MLVLNIVNRDWFGERAQNADQRDGPANAVGNEDAMADDDDVDDEEDNDKERSSRHRHSSGKYEHKIIHKDDQEEEEEQRINEQLDDAYVLP